MRDRLFPCSLMIPSGPQYDRLSATFQICAGAGSKSGQPYIQGSEYLSEQYGFLSSHIWRCVVSISDGKCLVTLFNPTV